MNTNQPKTRIYNLIILDKSGSMSSIREAALNGCNEVLSGIKSAAVQHAETQEHFVSLILFDTESMPLILDRVPANEVRLMTHNQFVPCACTPLLDAIGIALTRLEKEVKQHERAIASVTIITDGYENASQEFNLTQIHQLIGRLKEEESWNIAFMGANQDVSKVCMDLNIDVQNSCEFHFSIHGAKTAFQDFRDGNDSFYCAMDHFDRGLDENIPEWERKSRRRHAIKSHGFFRGKR